MWSTCCPCSTMKRSVSLTSRIASLINQRIWQSQECAQFHSKSPFWKSLYAPANSHSLQTHGRNLTTGTTGRYYALDCSQSRTKFTVPVCDPSRKRTCNRRDSSSWTEMLAGLNKLSREKNYSIVSPGVVSNVKTVPEFISKPLYAMTGVLPSSPIEPEIKTESQINAMRKACKLARKVLDEVSSCLKVGMTTNEIDCLVHEMAVSNQAYPSPLLYKGFPKSCCTSVNNVACHGIPDDRPLVDGDLINIDITVFVDGFHGDTSETFLIGNVDKRGCELVDVARECMELAVNICKPGERFSSIGDIISYVAQSKGYDVIPEFCGHGIGTYFHGKPDIFHFVNDEPGVMKEGMTFTIEPIITEGDPSFKILKDNWTVVSKDNSRSAQFEHTVLITNNGVDILTE